MRATRSGKTDPSASIGSDSTVTGATEATVRTEDTIDDRGQVGPLVSAPAATTSAPPHIAIRRDRATAAQVSPGKPVQVGPILVVYAMYKYPNGTVAYPSCTNVGLDGSLFGSCAASDSRYWRQYGTPGYRRPGENNASGAWKYKLAGEDGCDNSNAIGLAQLFNASSYGGTPLGRHNIDVV